MEKKEINRLGRSLLVPSVQKLAKDESLTKVPPRYVRPPHQHALASDPPFSSQLPVIDLSLLSSPHHLKASELTKFHHACQHWGFFQVINHGVEESLVERVKEGVKGLFNLGMEEKKKLWQTEEDIEGFGQGFVKSEEQKLDWADMFYLITLPPSLRKPHLFPNLPLPFKYLSSLPSFLPYIHTYIQGDDLEAYSGEMRKMTLKILEAMVETLGMQEKEMKQLFEEGWQSMRMNYYPPCPQPELVNGLSPHSDGKALTILLQVNETEQGLQIKHNGQWIPVSFIPNAFVVNIGDMLEVVTNGIYKSIEHRATVNLNKERMSLAAFYGPKLDGELGPTKSLVSEERPALFETMGVAEFFKGFLSRELVGKSYLDTIRIHPTE